MKKLLFILFFSVTNLYAVSDVDWSTYNPFTGRFDAVGTSSVYITYNTTTYHLDISTPVSVASFTITGQYTLPLVRGADDYIMKMNGTAVGWEVDATAAGGTAAVDISVDGTPIADPIDSVDFKGTFNGYANGTTAQIWISTAAPTNGDTTHLSNAGQIFDYCDPKFRFIDYADSPLVYGGMISAGSTPGTYQVSVATAYMRSVDCSTGALVRVVLEPLDDQAIGVAGTIYTVSLNYNDGSPTVSLVESSPYAADKRNIPLGKVMKNGDDEVHSISSGFHFQDGVQKLHQRAVSLRAIELASGSAIAYSGTDSFTMTDGIVLGGINKFTTSSYDSWDDSFTYVHRDSGVGWTYHTSSQTIKPQYDDGSGTLANIGIAKHGAFWVYYHIDDGHVYVRFGEGSYSLAEAEAALEPTKPDHLTHFGLLIGKIVAPQAGGSFDTVQMVTDMFFSGTSVADHNELGNLQGGSAAEYYHLDATEFGFLNGQDQSVLTTSDPTYRVLSVADLGAIYGLTAASGTISGLWTVGTLDTGQGATEVYAMDQNVLQASDVLFNSVDSTITYSQNSDLLDGWDSSYILFKDSATLTYMSQTIPFAGDVTGLFGATEVVWGNIAEGELADQSVVTADIKEGTILVGDMAANSIDSDQYVDGSIDLIHMSVESIDSDQYVDGSIDATHLAADIIDETKIADNGIDSEHYNDGSIDRAHLANDIDFGTDFAISISTPAGLGTVATLISPFRDYAVTITSITAQIIGGTNVVLMVEQRTIAGIESAGTDIWGSDLTVLPTVWVGLSASDFTVPAGSALVLVITSEAGDVDRLMIKGRYTVD